MRCVAHLFAPLALKGLTLSNRIVVSPMCEYSSVDGFANDWHFVHLGSRAVGGAALVFTEATAVTAEGRISPDDLGIWKDDHVEMLERIVRFVHRQGSAAGVQLAHAGRKGSTAAPWKDRAAVPPSAGGWQPIGPTGDNLKAAIASETHEYTDVYPGMARVARQEGFDEIADWFETLAKAGKSHARRFQKALEENWNTIGGKHGRKH